MTETKDNSSLPLLLSITGAVLAVAVGGWFLLNQQSSAPDAESDAPRDIPAAVADAPAEPASLDNPEASSEPNAEAPTAPLTDDDKLNVDTELRKARLASDADLLVLPAAQSALFYYRRVISIDPQHAIAIAELDAILANVSKVVSQYLAREEYDSAYEIAVLVARYAPEHALVIETQTTLDTLSDELIQRSINAALNGDDGQADQLLASALTLPGRNPDYFREIRDSIAEIRTVREAAARDRTQRAQLAEDDARTAWFTRTRASIAAGNLIAPAGASARDLLAEPNPWSTERTQLTGELVAALQSAAMIEIESQNLEHADNLLIVATELAGDSSEMLAIRAALESAFIEDRSKRVLQVSELVVSKTPAARYPKNARERSLSGWVDIHFTVTPSGNTADIEIADSEPTRTFDRAATKAVEQWTFQPVEFRGQIISQRAATRLVFVLE